MNIIKKFFNNIRLIDWSDFKKHLFVFVIGGITYSMMEVIFHAIQGKLIGFQDATYLSLIGFTSIWMIFIGGLCVWISSLIHQTYKFTPLVNLLICLCSIWGIELMSGELLNLFNIPHWSYKEFPLNVDGQITFIYAPVWAAVIPFGWWFIDVLDYLNFGNPEPRKLFQYYLDLFKKGNA